MTTKEEAPVRIEDWNQRYPAGTPVKALLQDGTLVQAVTNSGAWIDTGIGDDRPKIEILLRRAGLAETDSGRRQLPLDRVHVLAPLPILKDWNNRYPAGTAVTYTLDDGRMIETVTRSEVWRLADGSAVILVDGQSGAVAFERVDLREVAKDETERDIERLRAELQTARQRIEVREAQIKGAQDSVSSIQAAFRVCDANRNAVYKERDMCVALIVRMADALGYRTGTLDHHSETWDPKWRTIVYVDLPTGQVSWHIHDLERDWFKDLPPYAGQWDSHDTEEKYRRVLAYNAEQCTGPLELVVYMRQADRRIAKYSIENERLQLQVTELQARMTRMVEEHRAAQALQQQTADQFAQLRRATVTRCESVWFPIKDWSVTDWACALAGEVGEVCNAAKKLKRGDGNVQDIADELGDVLAYADLLAASLDLDLWQTVCAKFNAVSERVGSPIRLPANKG